MTFIFSVISLGFPARFLLSTSVFFAHLFSMLAEQPLFAASEVMAYQYAPYCASLSKARRTTRLRTLGESLLVVLFAMLHIVQEFAAEPAHVIEKL